jgi:hypothetical protein
MMDHGAFSLLIRSTRCVAVSGAVIGAASESGFVYDMALKGKEKGRSV